MYTAIVRTIFAYEVLVLGKAIHSERNKKIIEKITGLAAKGALKSVQSPKLSNY